MSRRFKRRRERYEPEDNDAPRRGNGIRQLVILLTVAFMVTLGVVVGTRLSSDAIAVLVGVIAGVAASIPCALLLMAVTRRREAERELAYPDERESYRGRYDDPRRAVPPVIVVTPGQASPPQLAPWASGQANWNNWDEGLSSGSQRHSGRQFRVMGYDESEEET
jgi:hypothetical protein